MLYWWHSNSIATMRASTCTAVFEPTVNTLGSIYLGPRSTYSAGAGGSILGNSHIFTDFLQWTALLNQIMML